MTQKKMNQSTWHQLISMKKIPPCTGRSEILEKIPCWNYNDIMKTMSAELKNPPCTGRPGISEIIIKNQKQIPSTNSRFIEPPKYIGFWKKRKTHKITFTWNFSFKCFLNQNYSSRYVVCACFWWLGVTYDLHIIPLLNIDAWHQNHQNFEIW